MKIGNIEKECKIHGKTTHGIYSHGKYKSTRCLECARENQKKRRSNPIKKLHDLQYTRKWASKNPEKLLKYAQTERLKKINVDKKRKEKIQNLFHTYEHQIKVLLNTFTVTYDYIFNCAVRYKYSTIEQIKNKIIEKKTQLIFDAEYWKTSSLIKYYNNVRDSFEHQTKFLKNKINSEAKQKAKLYTNKKIKELITKLDI